MVPHTYPTIEGRLVLGVITDITGLNEWQDYIPVVAQTNPVASSRNTFANDGYMGVNVLSSLTGLNAWIDYIPCYVVTGRSSPFSVSPDGYISVSAEVGTLGGASLADYIINSKTPDLVADFNGSLNTGTEFYDAGGTVDTFAELITHSRAGNATMTDGYGPELVTNGDFASDTGWYLNGFTISNGVLQKASGTPNSQTALFPASIVSGKTYAIEFDYTDNGNNLWVGFSTSTTGSALNAGYVVIPEGSGRKAVYVTATAAGASVGFFGNSAYTGIIDNVSVREVPAIKWAPHNYALYSEQMYSYWTTGYTTKALAASPVGLANTEVTATNVLQRHIFYHAVPNIAVFGNGRYLAGFVVSYVNHQFVQINSQATGGNANRVNFDLVNGTFQNFGNARGRMIDLGDGSYYISADIDHQGVAGFGLQYAVLAMVTNINAVTDESWAAAGTEKVLVGAGHACRASLGGVMDNPDRADSYVPTTSSAVYLPRRNHHVYNGDAWVNEGVLHESEARTNLALYSNDLSSATGWNAQKTLISSASGIGSPASTAWKLIAGTGGTSQYRTNNGTVSASTEYSVFMLAKDAGDGVYVGIAGGGMGGAGEMPVFDLVNGTIDMPSGSTTTKDAKIIPQGNGWYLCYVRVVTANTGSFAAMICQNATDNGPTNYNWTGDDSSGYYIAHFQFEASSTPSSYIPTSGSTVTRAAETLTIPAANMPWPEPNVIGDELVTNGTFDTDSDWTLLDATISGGLLNIASATTQNVATQSSVVSVGTPYRITVDITVTSGAVSVFAGQLGSADKVESANITSSGSYDFIHVPTGPSTDIFFRSEVGFTGTVDNISVREIDPLAVSIQMQGRMTYADTGTSNEAIFAYWKTDSSNFIRLRLRTDGSNTGAIGFDQSFSGTFDFVAQDFYSPSILVPYNIASRHGSTFINGAVDGTALTANTTPTALPDLSATDLSLAYDYMGTISMLRVWADDLADVGIAEATEPSEVPSLQLTFDNSETSFTIQDWEQ